MAKRKANIKDHPDVIGVVNSMTVEFLDRETFIECFTFLRRRTKVSLGEFLTWVKKKYTIGRTI